MHTCTCMLMPDFVIVFVSALFCFLFANFCYIFVCVVFVYLLLVSFVVLTDVQT